MARLKTYDGTEIFEQQHAPDKKAYVTGTPKAEDGHLEPQVFDNSVYLGENPGELVADTFKGALSGTNHSIDNNGNAWFANEVTVGADKVNAERLVRISELNPMTIEEIDAICTMDDITALVESVIEETNVLVEENDEIKRVPASMFKQESNSSGGATILPIDVAGGEISLTGEQIKEKVLSGGVVKLAVTRDGDIYFTEVTEIHTNYVSFMSNSGLSRYDVDMDDNYAYQPD